jgi:hypothetical protein
MKKFFLICLCTLISQTMYSQIINSQQEETQRFQNILSTTTKTLVINTTNYQGSTIREFKKELRGWQEKVISAEVDTLQKTFTIIHNGLLHPKEMEEFLKKYSIKSNTIISYN